MEQRKRILLIDFDDARRQTRIKVLENSGHEVLVRKHWMASEELEREGEFDLVVVALHPNDLKQAAAYSDRLTRRKPTLPILLLNDYGVSVPSGTLSKSIETGDPLEMMKRVASMLAASSHIRELAGKRKAVKRGS